MMMRNASKLIGFLGWLFFIIGLFVAGFFDGDHTYAVSEIKGEKIINRVEGNRIIFENDESVSIEEIVIVTTKEWRNPELRLILKNNRELCIELDNEEILKNTMREINEIILKKKMGNK